MNTKKIRTKFLVFAYDNSQKSYIKHFKKRKKIWQFTEDQLLQLEEGTLGKELGLFYKKNGFNMIPKMENHDIYHILTEYSINIEDEIALQYLLCGNGKRSLYLGGVLLLGTAVFPEYINHYKKAYTKGKNMKKFYHHDFEKLLHLNIHTFQDSLNVSV